MQVKAARIVPTLWTISRALGYVLLLRRPPWCRYRLFTAYISPTFYSMAVVLATAITPIAPRFRLASCTSDSAGEARVSVTALGLRLFPSDALATSGIATSGNLPTSRAIAPALSQTGTMLSIRCAWGSLNFLPARPVFHRVPASRCPTLPTRSWVVCGGNGD